MKKLTLKKKILLGAAAFVVVLLAAGGIFAVQLYVRANNNPASFFNVTLPPTTAPALTTGPAGTPLPGETSASPGQTPDAATTAPAPTATQDMAGYIDSQADKSFADGIVNVLLIGIDQSPERIANPKEYVNKDFNSDVMLLLAINFKNKTVDMISFPRDTYARIDNMPGKYKLNYALTAGGGINDKGFMNVCKSVQDLLDPSCPPVNYYIAGTIDSVKVLTDAVGGVDFNIDINFKIDGREYKMGQQHLNGQAVVDYARVRKTAGTGYISGNSGDLNRVDRQKKVLQAVFSKIKSNATIFSVPNMLLKTQGKVFTNLSFGQLAALASFGSKLDDASIKQHTLKGDYVSGLFNWLMVVTDQTERVKLIKDVYGVTTKPQYQYSGGYAELEWAYMKGQTYIPDITNVIAKDSALPDDQKKLKDAAKLSALEDMITQTVAMMNKAKASLYNNGSGSISSDQLDTQISSLQTLAHDTFAAAGITIVWSQVYVPETIGMKE